MKEHEFTNSLIHETSPYLLQHAHNPVDWNAWNDATLTKAKEESKLMVISIGYAACHWCHVMEHESFEDSTVAAVMNKNFISVKVDREERPDIDQIYINAVQLMTGRAGWPLNVITLPDGRPVFGGTYFKKEEWIQALDQVQNLYKENPQKLEEYASKLEQGIKSMDVVELNSEATDLENFETSFLISKWQRQFDAKYGGVGSAPKFMMPSNLDYLLRSANTTKNDSLLNLVKLTLDKMAYGGLYDQIGGGFARYSVDDRWHVPHFEKMLYDNAQLVSLYSHSYSLKNDPFYKDVVEETLEFIAREMTDASGAFYSSLDADSKTESDELEEGAYYVYSKEEIDNIIQKDTTLFNAYYNVNDFGKWEDEKYVLIKRKSDEEISKQFNISEEQLKKKKESWKQDLLEYRNKRPKPRLDDKSLTSWNGLMLKGYVDAYKTFQDDAFLNTALKNADFILKNQLKEDGGLWHNYKDGKSTINGYLEDYASVIQAFIALYEVTLNTKFLDASKKLADYCYANFYDDEKHMFYFTSKEDAALLSRSIEYRDNVIPSSNSIMAKNLFVLSHHFEEPNYAKTAQQMLKNVLPELSQYPTSFGNWMDLLANYQDPYFEVVVVGKNAKEKIAELNKNYLPNILIAGSENESDRYLMQQRFVDGETLIYVCVNNACKLPVTKTEEAIKLLN